MLYLYIIILFITGYSMHSFISKKPLFTIIDSKFEYPLKASFIQQNCKLDKSCWISHDSINGINSYKPPKISRNYFFVRDNFKSVKLPIQYFKQSYGNQLL